ncbi:MAG: hemolysin III family protein [Oscillospiraceae bacterium]|jgi:hemolysin III|nr:hemolysin III family protein [Oscillospiraceae bacterium]
MPKDNKEQRTPYDALRLFSALTHGIGFWMATAGIGVLIAVTAFVGTVWHIVSYSVYGAALVGLYATSTLYHSLRVRPEYRQTLRKLDHIMIYLLIAGTYTPICLVALRRVSQGWGWAIFGVIWFFALAGTIIKICWLNAPRWVSATAYVGMGWLVIVAIVPLLRAIPEQMPASAFVWLMIGGLFYTVGGILYALRWPGRDRKLFGFHEVFHIFILLGSISHFAMMLALRRA